MSKTIFEVRNVSYSYLGKFPALREINLDVNQGEKIAIIGANGSGKSTLLRMLDGLVFPDRGTVRAFGRELSERAFEDAQFCASFRSNVGFVFQNPDVQLFCPTVEEDIVFGPLQLGVAHEEIKRRLESVVDALSIGDLLQRTPHQLSVGEKRKVAIASTLAVAPEVIILDEPTAGLDPFTTRQIIDIILSANEKGATIVIATHDLHIVDEVADAVYILNKDKKIVASGTPREVLTNEKVLRENNLVHIHRHRHDGQMHVHYHRHWEHHE